DRRQKAARKIGPRNEVLMQIISLGARRFKDELVFEQTAFLTIQVREHLHQAWIMREPIAHGRNVDDRIKALEQTLLRFDMRLPAAAEILRNDEFATLE